MTFCRNLRCGALTAIASIVVLSLGVLAQRAGSQNTAQPKRLITNTPGSLGEVRKLYTSSHALLIGIDRYKHLPAHRQLHYAVKDVEALKSLLIDSYGFRSENIVVLEDEDASLSNIRHALSTLANKQKVSPEDRVLVYFSGHGQTVPLPDSGDMGFLIPSDADIDLHDAENAGPYLDTCLQMSDVWSRLDASPAKHVLLLADACYSGLLAAPRGGGALSGASLEVWSGRRARQVITAGGKGEESEEDSKVGHGVFTFQLLQELKARAKEPDSVFTTTELYSVLFPAVSNQTRGKQKPQMAKYKLEGEFLFVTANASQDGPTPILPAQPKNDPPISPEAPRGRPGKTDGERATSTETIVNSRDGAEMVYVPAGEFLMGDDDRPDNPPHRVNLSGYYIYKNLVTIGQYRQFCIATNHKLPEIANNRNWNKNDYPILNVNWYDAVAYCRWASQGNVKVTLPSEAQWEKAARGTDGRRFPWGDVFDPSKPWLSRPLARDAGGTTAVGEFGAGPYGSTDMAGNVCQWCADWYDPNFWRRNKANTIDPQNETPGLREERVVRGSAWVDFDPTYCRTAFRSYQPPTLSGANVGFRCVSVQ